ncbi:MAG: SDR family NAD(P)-dependent oxidoreductase [Moorea sp. SIO3G5]|nr:SDR family NAD(P)-dependent oxidoreductase [Moorena sp. SIO3G5]
MEPTTKTEQLSLSKQMFLALKQAETKLEIMERSRSEAIAIIGMGCRFPGNANTPESFWQLLSSGQDAVREIPPERWDIDYCYHPDPDTPGKMYIRHASLVNQVDQFDPEFFGISPREANSLDPQQRFLLEVTWEALERAGINPQQLENTQTGVFLGIGQNDYADLSFSQLENISPYDGTGNGFCFAAGRLSYSLGLQGPSMAIDTACSASLVAVHEACQSLRQGESNLALAGGVQLILSPQMTTALSRLKALSPDGRCKTFDAAADGYGRGEGCGIVVLKRLSDAVKDGDQISAVIRGSAVNHDGPSSGLTVPNKLAQEKLVQQALKAAKVEPSQVGYVEAHGTGTSLGDPMEVRALASVFEQGHNQENPLMIGSVKTNIGHLEAAAGIAGLIKVVLQLQHKKIAPHLNFVNPNSYIDWENIPLKVPTQLTPWLSSEGKRVGGVSSFAISGTNAHIVLEEAPSPKGNSEGVHQRPLHLFTLSAKTLKALEDLVTLNHNYLETHTELAIELRSPNAIADVCYTAHTGRAHFNHRLAVIASDRQELAEKLLYWKTGEEVVGLFSGQLDSRSKSPKLAFLFTGQGSQYVNMGRQLYQTQPTFRQALDECEQILQQYLESPLNQVLYPQDPQHSSSSLLDQTAYTQPALFAIEYALFKLWQSWGINPDAVMGHSVGEYVAATVAGVFSLEEGLKLIATRAKLMQQLPCGGQMVSVMANESKVGELITPYKEKVALAKPAVGIAAINGPLSVVISGEAEAIAAIVSSLDSEGIKTKRLQVSHAFHSPLMEPMLVEFEAVANQITYHQPKIPLISNVTGTKVDKSIATANYWVNHIRQPVKFAASMETLQQQGLEVFLEIGAKPILLGMGRQCLPEEFGIWLPSLRPGVEEWQQMLSSLGQLYVQGVKVDWSGFHREYSRQKVVLPTYPFQRERYWVETAKGSDSKAISSNKLHPLIDQKFQSPLSKEIFFESEFSTTTLPFLADHRIYEKVVVPGAAHISLVLAATSLTFPKTECQLEDILFPQALAIPEQGVRTVQVALTPQDSSYSFQVISFDDSFKDGKEISSWAVHGTGKISTAPVEKSRLSLEYIEGIQARCSQKLESTELYQYLWERQIQLGQSFRWIDQVWLGNGEVLCEMKVPQTVIEATKYQLHPALVDSCFQSVVALHLSLSDNNTETFVPFSVEEFTLYNPPENGMLWCYTRRSKDKQSSEKLKADIQLVDHKGELVAQVTGVEARKANAQTLLMTLGSDLSNWFYEINWQAIPLPSKTPSTHEKETGNWLVFALTGELTEGIGKSLEQKGNNCIWVSPGLEYQQLDAQHYQINPTVAEQFQQLLQDNGDLKGIVHLWSVNETSESVGILELEKAQELGCATVLHLVQALIQARLTHLPSMWLVTQGTQSVLDETEVVQPQQGALWGLGRVISLEHPELACFRVDLDPKSDVCETLPSLVDELLSDHNENQIAIRQGVRYVARLVPQQQQKLRSLQLSIESEACYIITGGLGALGLQVARWLVAKGAQHLVLIGRSAPSEMAMETIQELEQAGSQISVLSGDISNQQDTVRIMKQIQGSLPPLKGVIHAAGVLDDGVLQNMSWQQFSKVMAPKVAGTWHLHQLTLDLPLDFFVCFSSMASMLGSPGQGNYAAANGFMDAVAHYRRGMGLPGLSINWGAWASAGMAARLEDDQLDRLHNSGLQSIGFNEGIQALEALLQLEVPQVGVIPVNWSRWFQVHTGTTVPMLKDLAPSKSKETEEGWLIQHLEAVSPEERRKLLTNQVRLQVAQVLGIADPEQIDSKAGLFDIGIDSLMLTELRNRLQSSLGCRLSATVLFNYNTIDDLVDYLAQDVLQLDNVGIDIQDNSPVETPIEMRSDLDDMDQDQVETSISQELEELEVLLRKG